MKKQTILFSLIIVISTSTQIFTMYDQTQHRYPTRRYTTPSKRIKQKATLNPKRMNELANQKIRLYRAMVNAQDRIALQNAQVEYQQFEDNNQEFHNNLTFYPKVVRKMRSNMRQRNI